MAIIELKNVNVYYENYHALQNANLQIFERDFIGIIGPNGGGKTTLVKTILGQVPYSGDILYSKTISNHANKGIGYLPQQSNFDRKFPISVRELVLSGLQSEKGLRFSYKRTDFDKADAVIERTGIKNLAGKPISDVSGGQLQRALLSRALISEPKVLVLDEPATFVDNQFEYELYDLLKTINDQEGTTIVMVSHDIGTITPFVKSIVCVNRKVHRHNSNEITPEQLNNYGCPIQLLYHGDIPHTVLRKH